MSQLVTVAQAAGRLGISKRTIQKWIANGKIEANIRRNCRGGQTFLVDLRKCEQVRTSGQLSGQGENQLFQEDIWLSANELSGQLNITENAVFKRAKREGWPVRYSDTNFPPSHPTSGGSRRRILFPLSVLAPEARQRYFEQQKTTLIQEAAIADSDVTILNNYPLEVASRAMRRLQYVQEANQAKRMLPIEAKEFGITKKTALDDIAKRAGASYSTLMRWAKEYREKGIEALIDKPRGHNPKMAPEVRRMAFTLFADRQQLSIQQAYEVLSKWCREHDITPPSYTAIYRYLASVPEVAKEYWRKGSAYVRKNYLPPMVRVLDDLAVMECWMGDATTLDLFCLHPKFKNPIRPAITAWMDVKSRYIVGHAIGPTVSTNTVSLAFRDGALRFGLPEVSYVDNGKEYKNKNWGGQQVSYGSLEVHQIKGRWERLGIMVIYAWPYNPQSKAQVERWFSTLSHSFLNILPGYSGANIDAKTLGRDKERLNEEIKRGRIIPFDELMQVVAGAIEAYNHRPHRSLGNKAPADIFETEYKQPRMVFERDLDFCLAKRTVKTISAAGITINGVTYSSHEREYILNIGRKGVVAYDPRDMGRVHLYAIVNGREVYVGALEPREGIGFLASEDELKETIRQKRRAQRIITEAAHLYKIKTINVPDLARKAILSVDAARKEQFGRTIAARQAEGNVIQLIPGVPREEEKEKYELVGLFSEPI